MELFLAAEQQVPVKPGLIGFFTVAALGLALFLLMRSMSKQLHKIDVDGAERQSGHNGDADASAASSPRSAPDEPGDPSGGSGWSRGDSHEAARRGQDGA